MYFTLRFVLPSSTVPAVPRTCDRGAEVLRSGSEAVVQLKRPSFLREAGRAFCEPLGKLRTVSVRAVSLSVLLVAGLAVAAAHPWSLYDDTKGLWLKGIIRSTTYDRPQQTMQLDVEKPVPKTWTVVLASPSKMETRGVPVSKLTPGLKAAVFVYPARDVADEGRALRIVIDGNTTELW
jgi:hypothetical protein